MDKLIFTPLDTLFFRDGRPFNQGESNAGVESQFPPSPVTMVGAARVALARANSWPGRGKWIDTTKSDLGGDGDKLDNISFSGPLLECSGEPVFPVPASLIGKLLEGGHPQAVARLKPGEEMRCDLGENIRLPAQDVPDGDTIEGRKLLEGWWLSRGGLARVLNGGIPEKSDYVSQESLWKTEPKVGNQIDADKGTVVEGMLYSTDHVRLADGVTLVMGVEDSLGLRNPFPDKAQVPLGGEARSGWLEKKDAWDPLPSRPKRTKTSGLVQYAVHVLTPLDVKYPPMPGQPFAGLPGTVVSACLSRAQRWGGWDSAQFEPKPMKPHLAPGSVLFMETTEDEKAIHDLHGTHIGNRTTWGFGLIAIGTW